MAKRKKNPLYGDDGFITKNVLIGAAVIAALSAVYLIATKPASAAPKKSLGITVDAQCNTFSVTNEAAVRDAIRAEVRLQTQVANTAADPFVATRAYLKKAAPHCTTYPNNTRNPGEAALFVLAFNTTLDVMEDEKLLSVDQMAQFKEMLQIWALNQGIPPEEF